MGEVKWLPLAKGRDVRLGGRGGLPGKGTCLSCQGLCRKGHRSFSLLRGLLVSMKNLPRKRVLLYFSLSFFLLCLLGKFPLPRNGSLITDTDYTANMYFANERHPRRAPQAAWGTGSGEGKARGCRPHTGPGSRPHFLSPWTCGLRKLTLRFRDSVLSSVEWGWQ